MKDLRGLAVCSSRYPTLSSPPRFRILLQPPLSRSHSPDCWSRFRNCNNLPLRVRRRLNPEISSHRRISNSSRSCWSLCQSPSSRLMRARRRRQPANLHLNSSTDTLPGPRNSGTASARICVGRKAPTASKLSTYFSKHFFGRSSLPIISAKRYAFKLGTPNQVPNPDFTIFYDFLPPFDTQPQALKYVF